MKYELWFASRFWFEVNEVQLILISVSLLYLIRYLPRNPKFSKNTVQNDINNLQVHRPRCVLFN